LCQCEKDDYVFSPKGDVGPIGQREPGAQGGKSCSWIAFSSRRESLQPPSTPLEDADWPDDRAQTIETWNG